MAVATYTKADPTRHCLVMPDCDCGTCAPTWARRRGRSKRFSEPVTLLAVLEAEDVGCWAPRVESHRSAVSALVRALDEAAAVDDGDGLGDPVGGSSLAVFAGELASVLRDPALRAQLPAGLVSAAERTISEAMATVAGCLAGALAAVAALSGLIDEPPF